MSGPTPGTPLPWSQSHRERYSSEYKRMMYSTDVYCTKGETIATLAWYPDHRPDGSIGTHREANARYIVHACNTFPALVEALEGLERYLRETAHHNAPQAAAARAALAKAKGGEA